MALILEKAIRHNILGVNIIKICPFLIGQFITVDKVAGNIVADDLHDEPFRLKALGKPDAITIAPYARTR